MRIAALLTCHNRRAQTLACLGALYRGEIPRGDQLDVFLVDDGSSDGTGPAVRAAFPMVNVIDGDGSLFWNGGMRRAFEAALQRGYDAYLWLNDDTMLYPQALRDLVQLGDVLAARSGGRRDIVVGATCDPVSRRLTYGGLVSRDRWSPNYYVLLPPADVPQECQSLNGNCVLIPAEVATVIGNIDGAFVHAIGDWDYGLRARRAGFRIWMAPGFVGECILNNPPTQNLIDMASLSKQWRRVCGPKGVPPRAWRVYVRRHYGFFWPFHFIRPYVGAVARVMHAKWRLVVGGRQTC